MENLQGAAEEETLFYGLLNSTPFVPGTCSGWLLWRFCMLGDKTDTDSSCKFVVQQCFDNNAVHTARHKGTNNLTDCSQR